MKSCALHAGHAVRHLCGQQDIRSAGRTAGQQVQCDSSPAAAVGWTVSSAAEQLTWVLPQFQENEVNAVAHAELVKLVLVHVQAHHIVGCGIGFHQGGDQLLLGCPCAQHGCHQGLLPHPLVTGTQRGCNPKHARYERPTAAQIAVPPCIQGLLQNCYVMAFANEDWF